MNKRRKLTFVATPFEYIFPGICAILTAGFLILFKDMMMGGFWVLFTMCCSGGVFLIMFGILMMLNGEEIPENTTMVEFIDLRFGNVTYYVGETGKWYLYPPRIEVRYDTYRVQGAIVPSSNTLNLRLSHGDLRFDFEDADKWLIIRDPSTIELLGTYDETTDPTVDRLFENRSYEEIRKDIDMMLDGQNRNFVGFEATFSDPLPDALIDGRKPTESEIDESLKRSTHNYPSV